MTDAPQPNSEFIKEFQTWLFTQGKSVNTVKAYTTGLRNIPENVEEYFANQNLKGVKLKIVAYRSYLGFLAIKKKVITRESLMDFKDTFKPPKRRANGINEQLFSIPKSKWVQYIKKSPNKVAKMGIWIGFQFGLRLNEIVHLRVQDIDFRNKNVLIREHKETKTHEAWKPKYNKQRILPFTSEQEKTLKRWISEIRPKDLDHTYLLWNERGNRKNLLVQDKTFERWCHFAGKDIDSRKFKPHIMRYSFATHYYNESKDVKLVGDLLGHSNVATTSDYLRLGLKETLEKARDLFGRK